MIPPYHSFALRAEDDEDSSSNPPVVAIAVSVSVGSIILIVVIYRLLRGFFHKKLHPLPPPQPLAHHRAQFLEQNDSASRPSTGYSVHQSSYPKSLTLNMSSAQGSTSSLIASRSLSATRASPVPSVGDMSHYFASEHTPPLPARIPVSSSKEPFPSSIPDTPPSPGTDPSFYSPSAIPRPGSRSRPVSAGSSLTAQVRASRRISSSSSIRVRCAPHSPHSGVQVVLPAPLAPTLYPTASGTPPSTPGGTAGDRRSFSGHRMSLVDAWAPVPYRGVRPEKSLESSLRHERPVSSRSRSSSVHSRNPTTSSSSGDHSQQAPVPPMPSVHNFLNSPRASESHSQFLPGHNDTTAEVHTQQPYQESASDEMVVDSASAENSIGTKDNGKASIDA